MDKSLIVIVGPTGIGKTDMAIAIAKHYNTEIISADSRQIYKELKIGTAVPDDNQLQEVRHHFIGNRSIFDYYNASMFEIEVLDTLNKLYNTYDSVVMTGGSGMYIDAVCNGIDDIPTVDQEIRQNLIDRLNTEGIESLRKELKIIDPDYYARVDLKNPKRILKALEISVMTGKPYSSFLTQPRKKRDFDIIKIGLTMDRDMLYERINKRVDQMIESGLIEEARSFHPPKNINALNTVGYKELFDYFDGNISLEKAIELIKRNTRHYARKQITWFMRDKEISWFEPSEIGKMIDKIERSK